MRNRGIVGLMVFCALVTAVSLGALALPPAPVQQAVPQPLCVLRDDGGRLAVHATSIDTVAEPKDPYEY